MAWLGSIFAGIWAKLAIAGAIVLGLLAAIGIIRKGGKDAERVAMAKRESDMRRTADEVERRVDAAGPDERERLRNKWTRP